MMHGMAQPTFSAVLTQVLEALLRQVQHHISLPTSPGQGQEGKVYAIVQIPHVIVVLDCTRVALVAPKAHKAVYRNHYHSMNVQVTCTPNLTHCFACYPGCTHDAMVLWNSTLPGYTERHRRQHTWIVDDSRYPQLPWLITPLCDTQMLLENAYYRAPNRTGPASSVPLPPEGSSCCEVFRPEEGNFHYAMEFLPRQVAPLPKRGLTMSI
ncbi:putative nuclease HARBI1 isoform X1 [Ambystoma mexicanum]|uniref:putative nuclease HARBI1 isoform X1 n=1 Tax=Ambystoma mexicanum TaxID=8296 RepID=UPI0037E99536